MEEDDADHQSHPHHVDADDPGMVTFLSDSDVAVSCAFCFLSAEDLASASTASTMWKATARLDLLWLNLASSRWADKQNHALTPERLQRIKCSRNCQPWFERYAHAERDARRTAITREEICGIDWRFSDGLQRPRFKASGELHMELYTVLKWSFAPSGDVIIENFPPHAVHRTADWGWLIKNEAVSFVSRDTASLRCLPPRSLSRKTGDERGGGDEVGGAAFNGSSGGRVVEMDVDRGASEGLAEAGADGEAVLDDTEPLPSDATQEDLIRRMLYLHERRRRQEADRPNQRAEV